jgi:hypothetical protein
MTKRKPANAEKNPPEAFAAAFKNMGGVPALTRWAKSNGHNRAAFYALYSKLSAAEMADINANTNSIESEKALRAKLEHAFLRVIAAQKASVGDPAVYVDGERVYGGAVVIDARANRELPAPASKAAPHDAAPQSTQQAAPHGAALQSPAPVPEPAAAAPQSPAPDNKPQPVTDNVVPLRSVTQSSHNAMRDAVPGLSAGVALDGLDDKLSTTERFLLWPGHGRPP